MTMRALCRLGFGRIAQRQVEGKQKVKCPEVCGSQIIEHNRGRSLT
jgi:hypothetical protein